jgi:hypothetical protein
MQELSQAFADKLAPRFRAFFSLRRTWSVGPLETVEFDAVNRPPPQARPS